MMLSHLDARNRPTMVDIGGKPVTRRTAHAVAVVSLPRPVAGRLQRGEIITKKGAVLQAAVLAGIIGAKKTSELIPLCHPLPLEDCKIEITAPKHGRELVIHCRVATRAKTGVEMEALTGASVAALTVYDMAKALSHGIVIKEIRLLEKTGGKKDFRAKP